MPIKTPNPEDLTELVYYLLKLFPHLHISEMTLLCQVASLPTNRRAPSSFDIQRAARTLLDNKRIRLTSGYKFEVIDVQTPPQAPPAGSK